MKPCLAAVDTSSAPAQVPLVNRFLGENVVGFDSAYRCCLRAEEDRAGNSKKEYFYLENKPREHLTP